MYKGTQMRVPALFITVFPVISLQLFSCCPDPAVACGLYRREIIEKRAALYRVNRFRYIMGGIKI
jgi:hypothetical protein